MKIAVASGKGGTGKTTVAVNLYHYFNRLNESSLLVDCDVEEPNDKIFFPDYYTVNDKKVHQLIPEIDKDLCIYCRKCVEFCEFSAIVVIPPVKFAEVNPFLCHSCGACSVACNFGAISEQPHPVGKVSLFKGDDNGSLLEGRLNVGSAMQTLMIRELKKEVPPDVEIAVYDAPPGTSCPVVETISDMDYVVLVSEPTPFGLHDLKLMVELLAEVNLPFGVIINKAGSGDQAIYRYLEDEKIDILGEIPFDRLYAEKYSKGKLFDEIPGKIRSAYEQLMHELEKKMMNHERINHTQR